MSICVLYLRIFPGRKFHYAVYTVMAVTIAYTTTAVFVTIFACHPISKSWNKSLDGTCLSSRSIWYGTSIMIILTDFFIIILPINEIRNLKLRLFKKVLLACLFSLGIFVIICTVIRMVTVSPRTTAGDQICKPIAKAASLLLPFLLTDPLPTDYQAMSNSWTFVEVNVGIMCACPYFPCRFSLFSPSSPSTLPVTNRLRPRPSDSSPAHF